MATRTLYLISSRNSPRQRAHFSMFKPSLTDPHLGSLIHVTGLPMSGFSLEFKRNFSPTMTPERYEIYAIGKVDSKYVVDSLGTGFAVDAVPIDVLEYEAGLVPPPRMSVDIRAPVDDVSNRRCQEWTMDYLRRLVEMGILAQDAVDLVNSKRDPPGHGILLQPVNRARKVGSDFI